MALKRVRVFVSGEVQGVGFRYHTRWEARKRGLAGWVRNLPDGRVEALIEGEQADVDDLLTFLQRGPSSAEVSGLQLEIESPTGEFEEFMIR